uniref:Uncharacterized protein n=1 Tax=Cannabis sativa TaxID=3483 RepID=A0A803P6N3_CANSA
MEPLDEDGEPSRVGIGHGQEELAPLEALPQRGELDATWESPPSTLTLARFKNLETKRLVGGLPIDQPDKEHLAHAPPENWMAWFGPHVETRS